MLVCKRICWMCICLLGINELVAQELSDVSIQAGYNLYQTGRRANLGTGHYSYDHGGKFGLGISYAFLDDRFKIGYNVLVFDEKVNVAYWQNSLHGSGWVERLYKNDILQNQLLVAFGPERKNFIFRTGFAYDIVMNTNYEEEEAFTGKSYIATGEGDHFNYGALSYQIGGGIQVINNMMLMFDFITALKPKYITGESINPQGTTYSAGEKKYKRYWTFTLVYSIPFSRKTTPSEVKVRGAYSNPLNK